MTFLKIVTVAVKMNFLLTGLLISNNNINCQASRLTCNLEEVDENNLENYPGSLCARNCTANSTSQTCYYKFYIELYSAMGPACYRCSAAFPQDCSLPQCVPGGGLARSTLTVNRMLPGPIVEVCKNDKIVVDVHNLMDGVTTTIHWHGVFQMGTPWMDGVPSVSQCPIAVAPFRYKFCAYPSGTFFYHSHTGTQLMDGLYGPLIIKDPEDPQLGTYDYDFSQNVIFVSEWAYYMSDDTIPGSFKTSTTFPQLFKNYLINGKGSVKDRCSCSDTGTPHATFQMDQNMRYRFRIIASTSTVCRFWITFQNHPMLLIAADDSPVEPQVVGTLTMYTGERYDVVITANQVPAIYHIVIIADPSFSCYMEPQTADLIYNIDNRTGSLLRTPLNLEQVLQYPVFNINNDGCINSGETSLDCINQVQALEPIPEDLKNSKPDMSLNLLIKNIEYTPEELFKDGKYDSYYYVYDTFLLGHTINNITSINPPFTLLFDPKKPLPNNFQCPEKCDIQCFCVHQYKIKLNSIVDLILQQDQTVVVSPHPFHLHGHRFYIMYRGDKTVCDQYQYNHTIPLTSNHPLIKDTVTWPISGCAILRFVADNPGFWLFHCHFIPHSTVGMVIILQIGDVDQMPPIPKYISRC